MFLPIKTYGIFLGLCTLVLTNVYAQKEIQNSNSMEIGFTVAGIESVYYGGYGKFTVPLSQKRHYFTLGASLTSYFDFKGESTSEAYLKNDVDMRILPNLVAGYSLNFKKFQFNLEIPIGLSIAITKGTIVNEKIGFEREYSNQEIFFNYGITFSPKYRINNTNQIGLYVFQPLVQDKAQSGYQFGINWTKNILKNQ
ncbi:hypothetical protein GCM10007049_27520 [Echinicola pacifica]|uniref:Outer membrane protein beta-barrel domain-containing protein n=1 Tax=Echinicola pacifica TaxID=346377 RepID=A0A918Q580_9BACT|nr:hypothetical protein [Echinicola pacifica]GGZ32520.1 hypothetical protein GCM10007049_27520 [Echinicola pacifica]